MIGFIYALNQIKSTLQHSNVSNLDQIKDKKGEWKNKGHILEISLRIQT